MVFQETHKSIHVAPEVITGFRVFAQTVVIQQKRHTFGTWLMLSQINIRLIFGSVRPFLAGVLALC
jgi:hypothetical protein